jgi:hypothetical protein
MNKGSNAKRYKQEVKKFAILKELKAGGVDTITMSASNFGASQIGVAGLFNDDLAIDVVGGVHYTGEKTYLTQEFGVTRYACCSSPAHHTADGISFMGDAKTDIPWRPPEGIGGKVAKAFIGTSLDAPVAAIEDLLKAAACHAV